MKSTYKLVLMLLSFLFIVSSLIFVSCSNCNGALGGTDCIVYSSCTTDENCKDEAAPSVCIGGLCKENSCENRDISCGLGKCIPHDDPKTEEDEWFYCQCDEGAQFYTYNGDVTICVPKCKIDEDCDYRYKKMEFQYCDTEIGNCVDYSSNR